MWEQIRANQRKSFWLIVLMGLILAMIGYAVGEIFAGTGFLGLLIAGGIFVMQLLVYAVAGESVLMTGLGAKELTKEDSPRLFNIVEEMRLASGLGFTPKIYLIDTDSPNAFAIGRKPETSAIGVTKGLMYRLNRDELQGVVAHEIAHLKNMDTKFMTLAGVMLGSIIIMSDMAMRMFFYGGGRGRKRSDSRGEGNAQAQLAMLAVAILLIILGPILARLLYFAMSRAREYLADASAAVYTRYPEGLASALLNIGGANQPMGEVNRAVAPMFIVNPLAASGTSNSIFATHPPLYERVKVLRGMGGASFRDYEQAFQAASGGKSVIGAHTLAESKPQAIREASHTQPMVTRDEANAEVHALYGYTAIACQCGARLSVPSTYMEPHVRCIRCGAVHMVPARKPSDAREEVQQNTPPREARFMDYTRTAPGTWEKFPCQCGAAVQLSPLFGAPMIQCRKCGTYVRVHGKK